MASGGQHTTQRVVVRRGAAIAVYGSTAGFGYPNPAATNRMKSDAATMAEKLCRYTATGC